MRGRVWITAIKNIPAGAEITYDYCLYDGGEDEAICNCGAKKCRGSMYSKEEIRRRKRAAKRASKEAKKQRKNYQMKKGKPLGRNKGRGMERRS